MTPLKIETQDLAERQKQLTVEVPDDQIQAAMHRAARRMSQRAKIAGFRPGKAPYEVVLQRYGEEAVFDEALDALGQDVYRQALEASALDPVAPGALDDVVSREPLVLRYTVPLTPEVDLGSYREQRLPFHAPDVKDEAVEELLDGLRQQRRR
jgi:trigger factor